MRDDIQAIKDVLLRHKKPILDALIKDTGADRGNG